MPDNVTQANLTSKQARVLELVQGGLTVEQIAEQTGTSTQNVYNHVRNLREKGFDMPDQPARPRQRRVRASAGPSASVKTLEGMIVAEQRIIETLDVQRSQAQRRLQVLQEARAKLMEEEA